MMLVQEDTLARQRSTIRLAIDSHAHFYPGYDMAQFLSSASKNLGVASRRVDLGLLFVLAINGVDPLKPFVDDNLPDEWRRLLPEEPDAIFLKRGEDEHLLLIAGRQITTSEGLEVLALGTSAPIADHRTIDATVAGIQELDALAVLPWGFGKWLGQRGRHLRRFLDQYHQRSTSRSKDVFLGDIAGRAASIAFRSERCRRKTFCWLNGSDTLPLAGAEMGVGRFANYIECPFEFLAGRDSALAAVRRVAQTGQPLGCRDSLFRSFRDQLRLFCRRTIAR